MKLNFAKTMMEVAVNNNMDFSKMVKHVHPINQANKIVKQDKETELYQAYIVNANADCDFSFETDDSGERVIKAFFVATSAYLSKVKVAKIDEAVALILTDVAGTFMFGAIVEYHENEDDPDEVGNWSLTYTFNEEDISDLELHKRVKKMLYTGPEFMSTFDRVAAQATSINFDHSSYMYPACQLVINTITQILDREAVIDDTVDIECEGYFIASVAVEEGEKVFAITPGGLMKEIIKDDSVLEDVKFDG